MLGMRDRKVTIEGKKVNVIWYSISCCCGETFRSDEISIQKVKAELDGKMEKHISKCVAYDFINRCAMRKYSADEMLDILNKEKKA